MLVALAIWLTFCAGFVCGAAWCGRKREPPPIVPDFNAQRREQQFQDFLAIEKLLSEIGNRNWE